MVFRPAWSTSTIPKACSTPIEGFAAIGVDGRCPGARHRGGTRRGRTRFDRSDSLPRTVVWVAGRGNAETAGSMLAAALGGSVAAPIVVASEVPPWIGALDVLIVAGDDPGDPRTDLGRRDRCSPRRARRRGRPVRGSAARRHRRSFGGRCHRGCTCPTTSGWSATWPPGWPSCRWSTPGNLVDLAALADELDAEAFRNSAGRELFTNPAKTLAERMSGRDVVLRRRHRRHAGARPARAARCCCESARDPVAAVRIADALVAARRNAPWPEPSYETVTVPRRGDSTGPPRSASAPSCWPLTRNAGHRRAADGLRRRGRGQRQGRAGGRDATLPVRPRPEQQLAQLAVRLEMAAVYLRLVRVEASGPATRSGADLRVGFAHRDRRFHARGQVRQRIPKPSCGSARIRAIRRGWRRTTASNRCSTRSRPTRRASSGAALRALRRRAAVPGQGARRRRTTVAAGASERRAGCRGIRPRGQAGHPGLGADAQLPRPQPQTRTPRGAESVRGAGRFPARRAHRRVDARALRLRTSTRSSTCCPGNPRPTGCGRCSPRGSPRPSPTWTCWCPPCSTARSTTSVRGRRHSPPKPRRCSNSASVIPATPACSPHCCSTGSRWPQARASTCPRATCTPTCKGSASR